MCQKKNQYKNNSEAGSAMVISILVLLLMTAFVALAISRTTAEIIISSNDSAESRTYAATEANLESATRDFVDIFDKKLVLNDKDILDIQDKSVPGFDNFNFAQKITKINNAEPFILTGGNYSGLYSLRDGWEIDSVTTDKTTDVKVELKRRFLSDRIPIFQFGMFFEDDLELNRPPLFTFGGRVHTNGNLFITASSSAGIYLNSKVTSASEIINDVWKTGTSLSAGTDDQGKVFVNDASGTPRELLTGQGSVNCASVGTGILSASQLAKCTKNSQWDTQKAKFQGNLENKVAKLNMPMTKLGIDLIELVRRGKNVGDLQNVNGTATAVTDQTKDNEVTGKERFANKNGIRISMSDSQAKLPGCAAAGINCGVRLDGALGTSIGYQPLTMIDGYKATALNATRMAITGREIWIKIELVKRTNSTSIPETTDVTQDILSLGMTEPAPIGADLQIMNYGTLNDTRSIIKLQRFSMPGGSIPQSGTTTYTSSYTINGASRNLVVRYKNVLLDPAAGCLTCTAANSFAAPYPDAKAASGQSQEDAAHLKWANINNTGYTNAIVPFPIEIFDSREGLPNDTASEAVTNFGAGNVPSAGVMSLVDIDVANLRRFLNGEFNLLFPLTTPYAAANGKGLSADAVPDANGWVIYFSDRRGDFDFDGEYDMEDVFPNGVLETNEDLNKNGILERDFTNEAPTYSTSVARARAAVSDHAYYRRGVRLINGSTLPGIYDSAAPNNTKGFTFSSENGIYVKGNYNATGAGIVSGTAVTPADSYLPQNSPTHIPASIVGDAIIILSNNWKDSESFIYPWSSSSRVASDTVVRFAMLAGDPITGDKSYYSPSQFGQLNGGVHNFKRFLENWTNKRLNYSGSLINLFNSHNNNGFQKCCTTVYSPPIRDWTFDSSFLDVNRLPPGTPFIYSISFTGFQRVND